jgi:competence protein ComEC
VLLTGDLESPGLEDVLAEEPLDADVVLAPHHGSPRSNPGKFADWCTPEHVVISGSKPLGDEAVIESVKDSFRLRGAEIYHTAEDGCVRVKIDDRGIRIQTTRPHVRAANSASKPGAKFLQPD